MTRVPHQHDRGFSKARAKFKQRCKDINAPCARCGGAFGPIDYDGPPQLSRSFELGHIQEVAVRPDLFNVESNWQPEHCSCNRSAQAKAKKAKREQAAKAIEPVVSTRWVKPSF